MVKAVVHQAQGGEDRLPAGPRALLSWFQSEKKGLSAVKKLKAFSLCHDDVAVKAVVLSKAKERESIPSLGPQPFKKP